MIVTRFAPSPTGFLHIGGARTALFNWLFARHHGAEGRFLLRIEDTDRVRSTQEATDAIFESLNWLGITCDEEPVFQFSRMERHKEIVAQLLKSGHAYYTDGQQDGKGPAVRFKAQRGGTTQFNDGIMGSITIANDQVEDLVLLRSDGTPTYNLAVVVDDHDMGVTHVIRGNDHMSNTPKQIQIYASLGWEIPQFSHVPLILGDDGTKLSKRHGALSTLAYKEMGYLPEALKNYLVRLGWAHGDEEFFSMEQAIEWFSLEAIGKSPARFDLKKLDHLNNLYLRQMAAGDALLEEIFSFAQRKGKPISSTLAGSIHLLLPDVVQRAKTLQEMLDMLSFLWSQKPMSYEQKLEGHAPLEDVLQHLKAQDAWNAESLAECIQSSTNAPLKHLAPHLRMALTGRKVSPPIFPVMVALGKKETVLRIEEYIQTR